MRAQVEYLFVAVAVAFEMPDYHLAFGERAREAILDAEFGIEGALRIGRLVCSRRRLWVHESMRSTCSGLRSCSAHQHQHRVNRRMRAAAARILLDRDARFDDIPWLAHAGSIFAAS